MVELLVKIYKKGYKMFISIRGILVMHLSHAFHVQYHACFYVKFSMKCYESVQVIEVFTVGTRSVGKV